MFSKTKKSERIDAEQREQYEYARRRIKQKRNLLRHFVFFLAGSVIFIILSAFLDVGNEILKDWYIWAILVWAFFFLVHGFNVFVLNTFMGKEWEDRQLEKLKAKQAERLAELQKKVEADLNLPPEQPKPLEPIQTPLSDEQ